MGFMAQEEGMDAATTTACRTPPVGFTTTVERSKPLDLEEIKQRLATPFHIEDVKWKPQTVQGNRALAVPYIDARAVMDRLDDVLGIGNWQASNTIIDEARGVVKCTLSIFVGNDTWVYREDVAGKSGRVQDEADKWKSAYSGALKRVAVQFGIGRYLYYLPVYWVDYDERKKRITQVPQLPPWALPNEWTPKRRYGGASQQQQQQPSRPQQAKAQPAPVQQPQAIDRSKMTVAQRAHAFEAELVRQGKCLEGELTEEYLVEMIGELWPEGNATDIEHCCKTFVQYLNTKGVGAAQ